MPKYKYASVYEWFAEWAGKLNETELYNELQALAAKVDADTLQDLYQSEMDADGYFTEIREGYCDDCQDPDHNSCSLTIGCPCCDQTIRQMQDERSRSGSIPGTSRTS